jgi:hypothetical protein
MRRRDFIKVFSGAAVAWPLAVRAQQAGKLPTIGFVGVDATIWSPLTAAFVGRLRELGWIEDRTIAIEYRWSEGRPERAAEIAAEFVRLKVDVIVCFTPKSGHRLALAECPLCANSGSRPASFDDFVGACEQRRWQIDAERPGGLQIDDKLKLGRLRDRQIGRLGALENFAGVNADLANTVSDVGSVAHQPASLDEVPLGQNHRNAVARRQHSKLDASTVEVIARGNEEGIGSLTREGGEGSIDLAVRAGFEDIDWEGDGTGSFLHLPQRGLGNRSVGRIKEHGYPNRFGLQLEQYPKPLGQDLLEEKIDAGRVAARPGKVGNKTKFHRVFEPCLP